MPMKVSEWLHKAEDIIYFVIGVVLGLVAVTLLAWSVVGFVGEAMGGNIGHAALKMLESLLLVVMLVEILHTVGISLRSNVLAIEPFMIIGIIAAVRRILVVTAEQAHPTAEKAIEFQMAMLELGILTFMILALVGAVFMVRKFPRQQQDIPRLPAESLAPAN